ncbi:hypothetical protein AB0I28_12490 [Phytomonospora sp. NPDC050363]|uniref:hypothetical protein n=1 Tax=Phytomonospora sp. NPDC050363 TaxID=3155642 RepID=UPI0033C8E5F2
MTTDAHMDRFVSNLNEHTDGHNTDVIHALGLLVDTLKASSCGGFWCCAPNDITSSFLLAAKERLEVQP